MKAIRIIDGHPQLVNAPNPDGDGVQIKVVSSSICGSDLHMIDKGWLEGAILGHEFAGYTPEGKAVAIEPIFGCGGCRYCGDGYPAQCTKGPRFIGGAIDGGMAQYVEVPASTLVTLPSGFDIASASLVEPDRKSVV